MVKNPLANARDSREESSIPVEGRSPKMPWTRGARWATVHAAAKSLDVTERHESLENVVQRQTPFTTLGMNPEILHVSQAAKCSGKPLTETTHCSQPTFPSYLQLLTVRPQLMKDSRPEGESGNTALKRQLGASSGIQL